MMWGREKAAAMLKDSGGGDHLSHILHVCVYIYIYRERERCGVCIYIYNKLMSVVYFNEACLEAALPPGLPRAGCDDLNSEKGEVTW